MDDPPEDTRAYFRGQCLKKFENQIFGVNWDSISFNLGDGPIKRIMMEEPTRVHETPRAAVAGPFGDCRRPRSPTLSHRQRQTAVEAHTEGAYYGEGTDKS